MRRVFVDAIMVKVRDAQVANQPVYTAIGVTVDGHKDVLGFVDGRRPVLNAFAITFGDRWPATETY
jgi:hypothetical protein